MTKVQFKGSLDLISAINRSSCLVNASQSSLAKLYNFLRYKDQFIFEYEEDKLVVSKEFPLRLLCKELRLSNHPFADLYIIADDEVIDNDSFILCEAPLLDRLSIKIYINVLAITKKKFEERK